MTNATAQQNTGVCCQGRFGLGESATARSNTESASRSIRQRCYCHSIFVIRRSRVPRLVLVALLLLLSVLWGGCAATTTTVGVTSNEAPRFHEIGR